MATDVFREDLYYRISEITIEIPPLRDREGGRLLLAQISARTSSPKQQKRVIKGFTDDAHDAIEAYAWPGNVREMENKIKAARHHGRRQIRDGQRPRACSVATNPPSLNLRVVRQTAETHAIRQALVRSRR